ncbi:hypothetical protein MED222_05045 [Vibrio sp. MED222]|nr:hypothetical protein MED222_05045 [Vibrio sp. MED222]
MPETTFSRSVWIISRDCKAFGSCWSIFPHQLW